ncbi:MAG TPA: coproporphyrinogen-III oxidase family protein [Kofleriaceae bacterium]
MAGIRIGVYLHFPWCRKLCPYCDFAVETGEPPHEAYLDAILVELARRAETVPGELVSIYLGGGTPSLWRPDAIARAIGAIVATYGQTPSEVTIEANPTDCTPENLAAWRTAGITRVSIGVQSTDPEALVQLGRDHRFGDGRAAVERTERAGFATSADFIFGTPNARDVPIELSPDHLSVYELTIEDRTAFGQRVRDGRLVPLDEDTLAARYIAIHDALVAGGYEHYEISSYARPGKRAVHNSLYWQGAPFLGLGVGAASLELLPDGSAVRATNPRRSLTYLADPGAPAERVTIGADEMAADRAWLGMRTSDGVTVASLPSAITDWLVAEALAERRGDRICPTLRGFLMADRIAARIVEAW